MRIICYLKSIESRHIVKEKGKRCKAQSCFICLLPFAMTVCQLDVQGQLIVRSFSPLASAFWHSGQRYSNSEWLSVSTSLWIIRASRKRVALLHLAQLMYVSEMAVSRVPRTSSCMTDTCLSFLFQWSQSDCRAEYYLQGTPLQDCVERTYGEL